MPLQVVILYSYSHCTRIKKLGRKQNQAYIEEAQKEAVHRSEMKAQSQA